jgi:hypothetical protein
VPLSLMPTRGMGHSATVGHRGSTGATAVRRSGGCFDQVPGTGRCVSCNATAGSLIPSGRAGLVQMVALAAPQQRMPALG